MRMKAASAVPVLLVALALVVLGAASAAAVTVSTNDGMTLTLNSNGSWGSLTVDGNTVPQLAGVTGGFIVAPMEGVNFPYQRNTFYPGTAITGTATQNGSNVNFTGTANNLTFNITLTGGLPYIKVDGTVTGPGSDRAFMVYFRVPVDANGWAWADDVNTTRTITNGAANWYSSLCIVNQARHPYNTDNPFATITKTAAPAMGLSLSPLFFPPVGYAIQYNSQGGFWIEFELGTTPLTTKHPNTAEFHFTLYKHDPAWGNRSAVTRYHSFFPAWFTRNPLSRGGNWMYDNANRPVSPDTPATYGIVWVETSMWDDQYCIDNNLINCKYVEPWCEHSTWMTQAAGETAASSGDNTWYDPGKGWGKAEGAQMIILSGARNRTGTYIGWDDTNYWKDSTGMFRAICNPDLEIPNFRNYNNPLPTHNRGTGAEYWEFYQEWAVQPGPNDFYTGLYLDSVGGWWAGWQVVHNFATEHWPYYDYSPGIYFGTVGGTMGVPTMWAPISNVEFMKYAYEQMSAHNRPVMANSSSDAMLFMAAPWLDMIGAGESYASNMHNISIVRAIAAQKPSSFYAGAMTDAAMQDILLMNIYPGCGSDNTYKSNKALYTKYMPVFNALDAAGWHAITAARCSNANMLLERYGPDASQTLYLVLRAKVAGTTTITVNNSELGWSSYPPVAVTELLNGGAVTTSYDGSGNLVITSNSLAVNTDRVYRIARADYPPVANFSGAPTSGAPPLVVAFTDTSTNAPTSWSWTFGDGGASIARHPSHTYAGLGSYTVSLTATNAYGSDGETKSNYIVVATQAPTFVAAGTMTSSASAITPPLPAGIQTNDILLLVLETCNQAITIANQNGGTWAEVTGSPVAYGTAGSATATRLTVFWSRYNGTQGAPTTSDSGDHNFGRIMAIRGATTVGNPWDVTATGTEATVDTSGSIPGVTTTVGNTFVVAALATSLPDSNNATNYSGWTNANLTGLTECLDNARNAGNGGGFGAAYGVKTAAGAIGNTDVTCATASTKAMMSIAVKP